MYIDRNNSEFISKLQQTEKELVIHFADGAKAVVPFSEVRKIAESKDILWDRIGI